jgi:hydroxymethylbilane synthase
VKLVIGTRGSRLAIAQSEHIRQCLLSEPSCQVDEVELRIIKTRGDKILDVALSKVGGKGLFVKELETALLDGEIDLAVHSMKDMPSVLPDGLMVGAIPEREDPRDAWVCPVGADVRSLEQLPPGAVVGTSSLRRQCQLLAQRGDLEVVPIRGNVETRLAKLDARDSGMEALVLACAGLRRLGLVQRISRPLRITAMLPAVGQGALAIEVREADSAVRQAISNLDDEDTRDTVSAERAFLGTLEGGCQVPIGAHGTVLGQRLELHGLVATLDGSKILRGHREGLRKDAHELGKSLAHELLEHGALGILKAVRAGSIGHG